MQSEDGEDKSAEEQSHDSASQIASNIEIKPPLSMIDFPLLKIKSLWNKYFTSFPPLTLDLDLPLHKLIYQFYQASKQNIFQQLLPIQQLKLCYQITLNFSSLQIKIKHHLSLLAIFQNFQYEAGVILPSICLIMHYFLLQVKKMKDKKVHIKVQNYPQSNINQIGANLIQNFIAIEAVVLKVYQIKLMPTSMQFSCVDCKDTFTHILAQGNYSVPAKCRGSKRSNCKSRAFLPLKDSLKNIFSQRFKVQQIDSQGRTPRQIHCQTRQNMVGKVITGQTIRISGIIKTQTTDEKDKKSQGIFIPYILVNSLLQKLGVRPSQYDMGTIRRMKDNPNIYYSLLRSFCPTIFGHELVKAGLLLATVGGSCKNLRDQSAFRESSHVLLLGDPGIGKSQLLKYTVQILPHSIYVNASACSTSGLTVTVNKDSSNEQSLEAGALILADNAVCAIDEFDKAADSSALLEVMEQQTVSIAKAGIICQLKCRVSVVASANPTHGTYNKAKSFKDNTKISNAILSRFDLIFLLVDRPDPQRDRKLSQHIMRVHTDKRKKRTPTSHQYAQKQLSRYTHYISLADKYGKVCSGQQQYSLQQIKKYLSYVRGEIHPVLSREACEVIKGFYLALRDNHPAFQVTTRHLESLVRLAMARTRLECRKEVTEEDAVEVTHLMQESLFDAFEEMGYNLNALKNQVKKSEINKKNSQLSLPKQRNIFIQALKEGSEEKNNYMWDWGDLVKKAKELELKIGDFYNFIERLNNDGILLQKGNKRYQYKDSLIG